MPASRTPRRFTAASSDHETEGESHPCGCSDGMAEMMLSTPADDRHRDRHHVVDQQGAGHDHTGEPADVPVATS